MIFIYKENRLERINIDLEGVDEILTNSSVVYDYLINISARLTIFS